MYVENLKLDFYEFLTGKRILLMVHYDIDSICACKILQNLLKYKEILYTLAVIRGVEDLKRSYRENSNDVKYFVLINCGGTVNLVDLFEPEEDAIFFIIDSHRPTHLDNIYSDGQVRLLWTSEEDLEVPDFHAVYRDDSDEESDEEPESGDEDEGRAAKKRRLNEEAILKRRERRLWEAKRFDIIAEYSQYTYYNKASAIAMFKLAWFLNKDDKDLLWLAIVALTEQYILGKIENSQYVLAVGELQSHSNRLRNRSNDTDGLTSLRITYENDLKLVLYRHWSVESSLKYSMFTACKLKLWSHRGSKKLYELLADMGLPLSQSQQAFESMDLQLRKEFHQSIEKLSEKYNLEDLVFTSFVLQYGYRNKYCASDIVYAMFAILESSPKETPEECFNSALDCLTRNKKDVVQKAIERAKIITKTIFKTVQAAIDMKQIITAGNFVYYIIQEGCLDWYMFSNQYILLLLAQFILRAYVSMSRNRKAPDLPLIISAPKNLDLGTCVILGIPPLRQNSPKNNLGRAFEEAAENINYEVLSDYFDTSYFEINIKDRTRFFDALTALFDK
ncbi:cell division control protein 45 homolog [Tribolium castaneum]|uniref:Cell division control protein 45 homolog-like Protein n=1 Tax=Tribolium castaneum TaxID=7070 RepID=D2A4C4_TRICA|nr:PREDICTED: cell division control protein 45 homolog [Tribolium castaneum]XP_015836574.1 PREDICTED: cell division control protein 45 homolog [Tribolium castaneum]EFA05648.1 Cell division control protein 45 homolog-like Protein [Tribolium castaneum]|eukprot:XP_008195058.1 PREDICTED: cell division control protein 45 homolog [Tribolium castaneum]